MKVVGFVLLLPSISLSLSLSFSPSPSLSFSLCLSVYVSIYLSLYLSTFSSYASLCFRQSAYFCLSINRCLARSLALVLLFSSYLDTNYALIAKSPSNVILIVRTKSLTRDETQECTCKATRPPTANERVNHWASLHPLLGLAFYFRTRCLTIVTSYSIHIDPCCSYPHH